MKKTLAVLAFLTWATQSSSQGKTTEQLKIELDAHPQQDTFYVNRLLELSFSSSYSIIQNEKMSAEALSISRKIGYLIGEGYALTNVGFYQVRLGNIKQGDSLLSLANSFAIKTGDPGLMGTVLFRLGSLMIRKAEKEGLDYLLKAQDKLQTAGNYRILSYCQRAIANYQESLGNYPATMEYMLKAVHSAEKANSSDALISSWTGLGDLYTFLGDYNNSLIYLKKAGEEIEKLKGSRSQYAILQVSIGEVYRRTGRYPDAIQKYKQAIYYDSSLHTVATSESNLADVYTRMDSLELAFQYGFHSLALAKQVENDILLSWINGILARAYLKKGMPDSSIYFAIRGLVNANKRGFIETMRDNTEALAAAYAFKKDFANAYKYHLQYINYRDSLVNDEVKNKTALLQYNSDLNKKEAQITQLNGQKKTQQILLTSALIVITLIILTVFMLLRNNQHKQKANLLLQKQKKEIESQRDQTNQALANLQQTQKQLIQSEKMASLGELTAGIAHEIQNPLNFVNNFSGVSRELIDEMKDELQKGNKEDAFAIADDIKQNLEKINHHGNRADAIVKGMLQHSRSSSGVKEPTDINALCDEYLRLSYHGLRAKDKSFNANFSTDFDESIGKIEVVPQDIGRVLLNLYNNAFYAVSKRQKAESKEYNPEVHVSTKAIKPPSGGLGVSISVTDNGNGIPEAVKEKIFQPFFTTKPTGQGTGLGLSMSYDIVKTHGGEIKVQTKQGEGAKFVLLL